MKSLLGEKTVTDDFGQSQPRSWATFVKLSLAEPRHGSSVARAALTCSRLIQRFNLIR